MVKTKEEPKQNPHKIRLMLLKTTTISIPILFFIFFELILRWLSYGYDLSLFNEMSGEFHKYKSVNRYVGLRYFPDMKSIPSPPPDMFLKIKTEKTYRIVVLGGSSAAGYPYGNNVMFPRILNSWLSETFPEKNIEIINTAMPAVNSYTMLDLIDEVLEVEPDLIMIYAGHNEYYGAYGIGSFISFGMFHSLTYSIMQIQKLKIYELFRNGTKWVISFFSDDDDNINTSLMEQMAREQIISYRSNLYDKGLDQFRNNLEEIIKRVQAKNTDILISELVSNIKNHKPFISEEGIYNADSVYNAAWDFYNQQNFDSSLALFIKAKDYDALRFRAPEDFNTIISDLAGVYNFTVVPMQRYFMAASENRLIGDNLMLEHLHPNEKGYILMARAFYATLKKGKFISSRWPDLKILTKRENLGITKLDSTYAALRVLILKGGWPFKSALQTNNALQNFKAKNINDSLAVKIWSDPSYSLERGHVDLANHYFKQSNYDLCVEEYKALTRLTPFNASPYQKTAEVLIKQQKYAEAMPYLLKLNQLSDDYYSNKWIGQIFMALNKADRSIAYLERAFEINKNDGQLLYNYALALYYKKDFVKSLAVLNLLETIEPHFQGTAILRQQINRFAKSQPFTN